MDHNENNHIDFQEQYDILVEEEQEKQRKKAFWIMFFCLLIILLSVLGATYSYYKVFVSEKNDLNIDLDGDGKPDLNIDLNGDGICDINCDTDGDGKPDLNIDYKNDWKAHFNLDLDGDGVADTNLINQDNKNGISCTVNGCDLNCDTNGDHHPDINIDLDGDGNPDLNIDVDCDGKPDLNIDTNGDGKPDKNIDQDGDGICDINCEAKDDLGEPDDDSNNDKDPDETETPDDNEEPKEDDKPIIDIKPGEPDGNAILFVTYTQDVNIENMMPNTTVTQKFSVQNDSNRTLVFNLNWIDVINELTVLEGFTYQMKRDGIITSKNITAPTENSKLLKEVIIPAKTTYHYEIDYTFHDLENIDQTMDQNKRFSARISAEIVQ